MSLRSLEGMPSLIAMATHALYNIEPMTTLDVTLRNVTLRKRLVPIITLARPITTVPGPMDAS